jgi:hypothetical protein
VDADKYLLQLVRYIHRNPLRAGIVAEVSAYEWSSHRGYLSKSKRWDWLYKDFVLSMLTEDRRQRFRLYREFVGQEDSQEIRRVFEKKKLPSIFDSKGFIGRIRSQFF